MDGNVCFYNEDVSYRLVSKRKIRSWLVWVVAREKKQAGDISCIFCSDNYLLEINREYLSADYLTDVITFDFTKENHISGDIFISVDRVKENAKAYQQRCFQEMLRVIVHGVLHLCQYKDKTEQEQRQMREKEDYYLQKFNSIV
ncbi:MAG: rRNA maturation RNase YbeY [Bacteroidales bacterium]|jgi:rRNA maturation RNase YbeY|nr:rRNA maturation RNase YbeY [Bacteroidales bacterium]